MTRCDSEKVEDIQKVLDLWNTEQLGDRDTIDRIWDIMEDEP